MGLDNWYYSVYNPLCGGSEKQLMYSLRVHHLHYYNLIKHSLLQSLVILYQLVHCIQENHDQFSF